MKNALYCVLSFYILIGPLLSCKSSGEWIYSNNSSTIKELKSWLRQNNVTRPALETLPFSKTSLSKNESENVVDLLVKDKQSKMMEMYGKMWDDRAINLNELKMPFFYQIFGEEPTDK